jgi:hypothetical protein
MADDPGRTSDDIALAHKVVWSFFESRGGKSIAGPRPLSERFDELVENVAAGVGRDTPFLNELQYKQLAEDYRATVRVLAFWRVIDRPFVLALAGVANVYEAPVVIDVFSPEALRGVGYMDAAPPADYERRHEWIEFQQVFDKLADRSERTISVERSRAARGVFALFVDTLRALARGGGGGPPTLSMASASTTTNFEVTSANHGYRLHVFRQWRYRPRVFGGSTLSSPVTDGLATGHWCFEGDKAGGARIPDGGVHYCDPTHTKTRTTAF